ncbi:hypothetical protein [Spiroplasma endosymbiont of Dromius quadrimaculatus]|uniref:hypothetical protein n=1 Tax=Spiroplasma endosymbiont of Dromius quadrimaculatus TaxID=3066283 RepID=UPI00313C31FF
MKKILSLSSAITIAGGGIAGIIANSSYPTQQKLVGTSASSLSSVVVVPSSVVAWSNPSFTTFTEVTGTNGLISRLIVTPNGDIYAGTAISSLDGIFTGKVYKKDTNENVFKEVTGTTGAIDSLMVTPNGDIYAGTIISAGTEGTTIGKVYKKDANENVFKEVTGTNGGIKNLMVTPNGDIYAGTFTGRKSRNSVGVNGKVYKKDTNENVFKEVTGTSGEIINLVVTPNGDIYAGSFITEGTINTGKVYKKDANENVFKEVTGTTGRVDSLMVTPNGDIYAGTFTSSLDGIFAGKVYKKGSYSIANETFEKWYKFLAPDELKIEFNFNTVNNINVLFENEKKQEFIKELKLIVNKIPKSDHSGAGGSITKEDVNTVANVIWQHFPDFHETFENMTSSQKIIIKTNTIGYWDVNSPNNSIYIN